MTDEVRQVPSVLVTEAASLFHLLGGMAAKHLVIVGGLVPPLLLPDAAGAHIGSADIDLCLSVAITEGATRQYYKSIEQIISPYFKPDTASGFRWRKKDGVAGVPLMIAFLGPSDEWERQSGCLQSAQRDQGRLRRVVVVPERRQYTRGSRSARHRPPLLRRPPLPGCLTDPSSAT
jgi:hypothetical protein